MAFSLSLSLNFRETCERTGLRCCCQPETSPTDKWTSRTATGEFVRRKRNVVCSLFHRHSSTQFNVVNDGRDRRRIATASIPAEYRHNTLLHGNLMKRGLFFVFVFVFNLVFILRFYFTVRQRKWMNEQVASSSTIELRPHLPAVYSTDNFVHFSTHKVALLLNLHKFSRNLAYTRRHANQRALLLSLIAIQLENLWVL